MTGMIGGAVGLVLAGIVVGIIHTTKSRNRTKKKLADICERSANDWRRLRNLTKGMAYNVTKYIWVW